MANSPTGRNPGALWTSARQDVYNQMYADWQSNPAGTLGAQLVERLFDITNQAHYATATSDSGLEYGGQAATILYHMTGNPQYATLAYTRVKNIFIDRWNTFDLYQKTEKLAIGVCLEALVTYDWIRHGITPTQQADFLSWLNTVDEFVRTANLSDSDTDISLSFTPFALLMHLATDDHNSYDTQAVVTRVGGLSIVGTDVSTARNLMGYMMTERGTGGEWVEGSQYVHVTMTCVVYLIEAIRTYGAYFAEYASEWENYAKGLVLSLTPNKRDFPQWGDEQNPRIGITSNGYRTVTFGMVLAGVTQGTTIGPYVQQLVLDLMDELNTMTSPNLIFGMRSSAIALFNPYATASALSGSPTQWYAAGQGHMVQRNGWTGTTDSLFWGAIKPGPVWFHHTPWFFRDLQLWRRGKWALTHPLCYGSIGGTVATHRSGSSPWPDYVNSIRLFVVGNKFPATISTKLGVPSNPSGVGGPFDPRFLRCYAKIRGQKFGANYAYLCGTQGGLVKPNSSQDPLVFMHEHTPSLLHVLGSTKQSDIIIVSDRTNAVNPTTVAGYTTGFTALEKSVIDSRVGDVELFWHTHVAPTIGGAAAVHNQTFASNNGAIEWLDEGGEPVKIETLTPTVSMRVEDEDFMYNNLETTAAERKWRVRVYPVVNQQFEHFVTVVSARNTGTTVTSTLVQDSTNKMRGALVTRTGEDDVLAFFNGLQGANLPADPTFAQLSVLDTVRLRTQGFTVAFTQTTALLTAFLCDLNPASSWVYSLDGGADTPLTVYDEGFAILSIATAQAHTLSIGVGVAPPGNAPGTPTSFAPFDGQVITTTTPTLSWESTEAVTYDVYFGTAASPPQVTTNQTATSYTPALLAPETPYYWKIVARNPVGETVGPIVSFLITGARERKGKVTVKGVFKVRLS